MRCKPRIAMATGAVLAFVVAGCGSSSLSDAAFTSKANAICAAANAAGSKFEGEGSLSGVRSEHGVAEKALTKLEALSPPANRARSFHAFLSLIGQEQADLERLLTAAAAHDRAKELAIASAGSALQPKGTSAAKASGLSQCE
jgi:hypothetical protein